MTEVTRLSLENDMDVVVAHKRMLGVAQFFCLSLSTQTTLATAVAEVSRVVIDRTDRGVLVIGMEKMNGKFFLRGRVEFPRDTDIGPSEEGLRYAQLLVPEYQIERQAEPAFILVGIGAPRSLRITEGRVQEAAAFFKTAEPTTPYEIIKQKNFHLNRQAIEKEEELRHTRLLDEKKNEFISVASHELKTPLTTIMAFTKLALEAGKQDGAEKVTRYLSKIDGQVHKLHVLIQQLLDISKIESGKLDYHMLKVEWNGYMQDLLTILQPMVPSHAITWEGCEGNVYVSMDGLRIEQVLMNLVGNAAKYSVAESPIRIRCGIEGEAIVVCVRDEGIGISEESIRRVFDKYFRDAAVLDKYGGFGMGLYISASIVHEHGGTIWAERNEAVGSSFYFTLPLLRD